MSIKLNVNGIYLATGSMRTQSVKISRLGKRVARLKMKIKNQPNPQRRERLEKKYKIHAQRLSQIMRIYTHHMRQANHHLATLRTEF